MSQAVDAAGSADMGLVQPEPAADSTDESATLSYDDLFHLLQNERRRAVVRYLQDRDGSVRMRDVAEQVAAWEHDTTVQALTSDERQRVYISLYQSHLDTLAEAGVIAYNKPRGVIEPQQPVLDHVAQYIDLADPSTTPDESTGWTTYYLGATGVSVLLFGSAILGIPLLPSISATALGLLTIALFTSISIGEVLTRTA